MYLTGIEIKELAEYAGITIDEKTVEDDNLEQEFSVDNCPAKGVQDDDGTVNHYHHIVTCDGCDPGECTLLGKPINR